MAGRPRKYSREQTLDRALEVFWRQGFAATSLSDLSAACGVGPSSLYNAFGSKEGLYRECLERYVADQSGFVAEALAEPDPARAVHLLLRSAAERFTRPGCPAGCAVLSAPISDTAETAGADAFVRARREATRAALAERFQAAELPADLSAEALADAVFAVMTGLSQQARDGAPRDSLLCAADLAASALAARLIG